VTPGSSLFNDRSGKLTPGVSVSRRIIALALIAVGVGCLAWYGVERARRSVFQEQQNAALNQALRLDAQNPAAPPGAALPPASPEPRSAVVGRLEIPRVHLSVIVMEGDDDATLKNAVGHLPDTVMPWENGNSAFAGHRDTFFRPLQDVRAGDEIRLASARGILVYRVRDTRVVDPDDLSVLAPSAQPELTLVTCYPFYFIGHAPRRYIVRADRVDSAATVR
jgi:sortase A